MISAFGERSQRYARRLPPEFAAVIADGDQVQLAYLEALARRERGESFYGLILADDPRIAFAYSMSPGITLESADRDRHDLLFGMLAGGTLLFNGRTAEQHWRDLPWKLVRTEFYLLANAMLVRSFTEFAAINTWLTHRPRPVERVLVEPALPPFVWHATRSRFERPLVVVWAPDRPGLECTLHLSGLARFPGEIVVVAASLGPAPENARFVAPDDPALPGLLARANCVVCAEPNDPGDAVAFARTGIGIVAPFSSGAHEFVSNVVTWDAANATTLHVAVSAAMAQPTAVSAHAAIGPPPAPPAAGAALDPAQAPAVSVVIPTFNRPDLLRDALGAVAKQTYPNVEAVVVNDAGTPVDDVVAEFPFARLVNCEQNGGTIRAQWRGVQSARGDYILFLPDDDLLYPDHIMRIMSAMLRSGAQIAHSNGMLRYVTRADGAWHTTGLNGSLVTETLTPVSALIATPVSVNSVIHHRSTFDEVGFALEDSALNDLEWHMRQGVRYVFVHVDHITFEFREHAKNAAKSLDFGSELRRIYDVVHPESHRPVLAKHRDLTHKIMAQRIPGRPAFPPTLTIEPIE